MLARIGASILPWSAGAGRPSQLGPVTMAGVACVLAAACLLAAAAPDARARPQEAPSASASKRAVLKGPNGFRVKAPAGYRLRTRGGAYEVVGRRAQLALLGIRTTDSPRSVAEALLGRALPSVPDTGNVGIRLALKGGRRGEIHLSRVPAGVAVASLAPRGKGRKAVSRRERRRLGAIARSARNMRLVSVPTSTTREEEPAIPLRPFTTSDGSAKAQVPDGPGWTASGQQGIVEGGHPDLGSFAFGVTVPFLDPSAFCFNPCGALRAPFLPASAAIEQALPLFLGSLGAQLAGMRVVNQVPGSAGVLGPGLDSGLFEVTFTSGGRPARAFIMAGTFPSIDGFWYLYYSYIAAFEGVSGAVGDALLRTWQSWDPSADQARRQAQTFVTQQETVAIIQSATEYRRKVFDKTNYNWTQYIRGKDPVLDPVAPGVIGDGGETLVRRSDGKLFDFQGNEFGKPGG